MLPNFILLSWRQQFFAIYVVCFLVAVFVTLDNIFMPPHLNLIRLYINMSSYFEI